MAEVHEGGCLCGEVRFAATAPPIQTTICHCTFCQKLTGAAFLVEPIFRREAVVMRGAAPSTYDHRSDGSGKRVTVNFCGRCGTTVFLSFERFPTVFGVCAGAFDDPDWFDRGPGHGRHLFIRSAQRGVALPPDVELYLEHAFQLDGSANTPRVLSEARLASELD